MCWWATSQGNKIGLDFRNGGIKNSKTPLLHKGNENTDRNNQNQLFQDSENELKACNNLRSVNSRKITKSLQLQKLWYFNYLHVSFPRSMVATKANSLTNVVTTLRTSGLAAPGESGHKFLWRSPKVPFPENSHYLICLVACWKLLFSGLVFINL